MVKDDNDNELELGALCMLSLASPLVTGRIIGIKDGGMATGRFFKMGNQKVAESTPGTVTVRVELEFSFHPQERICKGLMLLKENDPEKARKIKEIYENAANQKPGKGLIELQ